MKHTPHFFAKLTVIYCIVFASFASVYSLWKQSIGMSMEGVLAIILGFFGGELLLLCLKTVLKREPKEKEKSDHDQPDGSI